jgi:carbamoylphosphate synthase large subunit
MELKSKFLHHQLAKELEIPVAKGKVISPLEDAVDYAEELGFPVYFSAEHGVCGSTSMIAYDTRMIFAKWREQFDNSYLVTKHIPDCRTLAIVGVISKSQVYIASFHDKIVDGSNFVESIYPMTINPKDVSEINESLMFARRIGNRMRELGFRGICGWNFIFKPGEVYFTNFIPSPQCTAQFTEAALLYHFPTQKSLTTLGVIAKADQDFPKDLKGLGFIPSQFSWSYRSKDYM